MRRSLLALLCSSALLPTSAVADTTQLEKAIVARYAEIVSQSYTDSLTAATAMHRAIQQFTANPSGSGFERVKDAWTAARLPYLQTEAYRFYNGPIDDENGPEGLLNAWPMDEVYLDYVEDAPDAGLINDTARYPKISPALIESLNEQGGETNISSGYHAIEFLLWGQDFYSDSAGRRSFTDYTTAKNAERRKIALLSMSSLLLRHLTDLAFEWRGDVDGNYRSQFVAAPPRESLEKMLTGLSMLSGFEMASERLAVAYDTQAQEDEHSCFSDTTHNDIVYDLIGIQNVWTGDYGGTEGPGLDELAAAIGEEKLGAELSGTIAQSVERGKAIPVPFDQAILGDDDAPGRKAILATIESLETQADQLVQLSRALGFEVPTSE